MKLNIYIGNHGKQSGIEDILEIIRSVFVNRGFQVSISEVLEVGSLNIIIDEFTNYSTNKYITEFRRQNPSSMLVLVLTEFIETNFLITSFNLFGSIFDSAKVALCNVLIKMKRPDYGRVTITDLVPLTLYSPLWIISLFRFFTPLDPMGMVANFLRKNHHLIYLHMRYLGFKKMLYTFDTAILLHPNIINGGALKKIRSLGVIYPEIDIAAIKANLLNDKGAFFEITGSISSYRRRWVSIINQYLTFSGMRHKIGLTRTRSFGEKGHSGAFSLHPPQTKHWKYCSPTRIYRAINNDLNIPVLTKKYNQHPIEDLAVLFEGIDTLCYLQDLFSNRKMLEEYIDNSVTPYSKIARSGNDILVAKVESFYKGHDNEH